LSELPPGIPRAKESKPRDSASAIVVRTAPDAAYEVLLGVRSSKTRFMPGHLAFPGGVVDPADREADDDFFSVCVRREVREETGLELPQESLHVAGDRTTPALFPVRFRNRFYLCQLDTEAPEPATGEFESLSFMRPAEVLHDWAAGKRRVPPPVLSLLRALADSRDAAIESLAEELARVNATEERTPRIEFVPGLWMLPVRTVTMPPATHTNVWMPGGERFVVIDPGCTEDDEFARLHGVIERRRELGHTPHAVVLTHGHQDHADGAVRLARELDLPLMAHPYSLDDLADQGGVARVALNDGDRIDLGEESLEALHTPGHHPGHLAFRCGEQGPMIVGDLVSGISTILIDPEGGDMQDYFDSLRRVAALKPRMLLAGHGPPLPGKAISKLIEHRLRREAKILERLSVEGELDRLAAVAYDDVPQMPLALTRRQTLSHLRRLARVGRVASPGGDERNWSIVARPGDDG